MVTHTPAQIVRRLAAADLSHGDVWRKVLPFLPALAKPRVTRSPWRAKKGPHAEAFSYYRKGGRAMVLHTASAGFGITAGTWITARLAHAVVSTDKALIVFYTTAPVTGPNGVLCAGARFLAKAQGVVNNRLMFGVHGLITCAGRQLPAAGVVFGWHYRPGLAGFVEGRAESRVWRALGRSLVESADQALSWLDGDTLSADAALGHAGRAVLDTSTHWRQPSRYLYVPPQRVRVQLQRAL